MKLRITPEQANHLKTLDSDKKRKEFFLSIIIENILDDDSLHSKKQKFISFTNGVYKTNDPVEIAILNRWCKPSNPLPKEDITPKEFCVEITEENKEVLQTVYDKFHDGLTVDLNNKEFLHSNSIFSYCFPSNVSTYNSKFILIVPTEEFLKLIGREDLIETPESKRNYKISEIVDKVVELSKEKLEFDLPKKEDESLTQNDLESNGGKIEEAVKITMADGTIIWKTNWAFLNPKQYTLEDMRRCFEGSRKLQTNPRLGIYIFNEFEGYINSLK